MLDRERLDDLLDSMLEELEGDWLLVGGALTALWLVDRRVTEDIDMVGLEGTQEEQLSLMQFADDQGLPVETVNSAVRYYLHKIDGWRDELEIFRESDRMRIFRPTPTLFLLLKVGRLSEQDLEDCEALLDLVENQELKLDRERVVESLKARLAPGGSGAANRARQLLIRLGADKGKIIELSVIVDGLEMQSDLSRSVLDRKKGEVHLLAENDVGYMDWDEPLDDFPDWQRELIEVARELEAGSDRYVELPDQFEIHEYRALEGFAMGHSDPDVSDRLLSAIRGRGAFRRFKDTVYDLGIQDAWFAYRQEFLERIARDWCEENGVPYRESDSG